MKSLLLPGMLLLITACSENKTEGSLHYRFTDINSAAITLANALYGPCPAESYCQTLLLRKGGKIPQFPTNSLNDIIGIYAYDKARFEPLIVRWNCKYRNIGTECLSVEQLNDIIMPYIKP